MTDPVTQAIEDNPERKLACPQCGSTNLATVESVLGTCASVFYVSGDIEGGGETDMSWDSSETVGVECLSCYWTAYDKDLEEGKTAFGLLVPQPYLCDHCGGVVEYRDGVWVHTETGNPACEFLPPSPSVATPVLAD